MVSPSCSARFSSSFVQQYIVLSSEIKSSIAVDDAAPWEKSKWKHVAPRKAIDMKIRGVISSSQSSA